MRDLIQGCQTSVLIPARNAAEFIEESLLSVLSQETSSSFDVIVINDHSTDTTQEIVMRLMKTHSNLFLLNTDEKGISNALNLGIKSSNSEVIIRHDADDVMVQGRIEEQTQFLIKNENYAFCGGQIAFITNQESLRPNKYPMTDKQIRRFILIGNPFAHPTTAIRRNNLIQAGLYNPNFDGAEDYELWSRLIETGKTYNSPNILTKYRIHDSQETSKHSRKVEEKTIQVQFNLAVTNLKKGKVTSSLITMLIICLRYSKNQFR